MSSLAKPTALYDALNDKLRIDEFAPAANRVAGGMVVVGGLLAALFALWGHDRFWVAYLVAFCFLLSISLGALFFVLIQHLTRAGWSVVVRRVAEAIASNIWVCAVLFIPLAIGIYQGHLHPQAAGHVVHQAIERVPVGTTVVDMIGKGDYLNGPLLPNTAHPVLEHYKELYLSFPAFMGRMAICFLIWIGLTRFYFSLSKKQDETKDPAITSKLQAVSAVGVLLFGGTVSVAGFDLLMALDPYWYSTMFGVYFFAGGFLAFFATLNLTLYLMRRKGVAAVAISPEHFHDTGKLMFAFTVFWAYIGFSQYMLIWYGNMPEESAWFLIRQTGQWLLVSVILLLGHFIAPFLLSMSRWPKRRPGLLACLAAYMLVMHFIDLYWLVVPQKSPTGIAPPPLLDFFLLISLSGVWVFFLVKSLTGVNVIPTGDPRLVESVHFVNQ
ncbi:MAG: quinol:cytochrome C oxidoreductase [Planctomycetes bacterium]|nr:quinol:cytochrome C oxidoreductase [Planctomycetota bacterium]